MRRNYQLFFEYYKAIQINCLHIEMCIFNYCTVRLKKYFHYNVCSISTFTFHNTSMHTRILQKPFKRMTPAKSWTDKKCYQYFPKIIELYMYGLWFFFLRLFYFSKNHKFLLELSILCRILWTTVRDYRYNIILLV